MAGALHAAVSDSRAAGGGRAAAGGGGMDVGIEELREKREQISRAILKEEEEKAKISNGTSGG